MTSTGTVKFFVGTALFLGTLAAYQGLRHNDFVALDDNEYLFDNPHVTQGLTGESVRWAFTASYSANWHPLTWVSEMVDCELFGLWPAMHHLHSLLLHVFSAVLLFLLLSRATGRTWPSAFVAAAFALHPLHVESVAWATERKDVLSALFFMLTLAAYLRYAERPRLRWYVLAVLLLALGLMAKPMLVTVPGVLLLLDFWPLKRCPRRPAWAALLEKVPFAMLAVLSCIVTYQVQQQTGATRSLEMIPLWPRLANIVIAYGRYLTMLVWPSDLAAAYPYQLSVDVWWFAGSALLLLAISGVALWRARRHPYLLVGWLWYLGMLVPVIGFIQVGNQALADRYTYLPTIGVFMLLAFAMDKLLVPGRLRWAGLVAALGLLVTLAIRTDRQVACWRDSETLFRHALAVTPENPFIHNNLGALFLLQGRSDEALWHFQAAVREGPPWAITSRLNLAKAYLQVGYYEEARRCLRDVLIVDAEQTEAYSLLGLSYLLTGQAELAGAYRAEALLHGTSKMAGQ